MSINIKLTEPVKMKGDRIVTRAAEYYILNAQAILDTHRVEQQALKKISFRKGLKIVVGILYALAKGRHLDFSNTALEMREGDKKWGWFKSATRYDSASRWALKFLSSVEIYGYVHRTSPQQCTKGGQGDDLAKMTKEIVKPSAINE